MHLTPTHPQAIAAVSLAAIDDLPRERVAHALRLSGCPRSLYTTARILRAARLLDELDAMHRAHPPIHYDPNAFGPGLAGVLLGRSKVA